MKSFLIKGGRLLSPKDNLNYEKAEILIQDGKIEKIAESIDAEDAEVLDVNGSIVSPGFIDIHTHCYVGKSPIGTDPDTIGIKRGCTSIFDAGTSGPLNYSDFKGKISKAKTHIYTLLNISDWGLDILSELSDLSNINEENIISVVSKNRDNIVGIKVRASSSVVGENGITPIKMGKKIAEHAKLPMVVHIGNFPPSIEDVLDVVQKNDVITHSFHGKPNGLFQTDGFPRESTLSARARGVKFDVGHGSESFSFNVCENALKNSFEPDFISTDLYHNNMVKPVGSLLDVITKLMSFGLSLEKCVNKVTYEPAKLFGLKNKGRLKSGFDGDFTIFKVEDCDLDLIDSYKQKKNIKKRLALKAVVVSGGKNSELLECD